MSFFVNLPAAPIGPPAPTAGPPANTYTGVLPLWLHHLLVTITGGPAGQEFVTQDQRVVTGAQANGPLGDIAREAPNTARAGAIVAGQAADAGLGGIAGAITGAGQQFNQTVTGAEEAARVGSVYLLVALLFLLGVGMFLTHSDTAQAVRRGNLPV